MLRQYHHQQNIAKEMAAFIVAAIQLTTSITLLQLNHLMMLCYAKCNELELLEHDVHAQGSKIHFAHSPRHRCTCTRALLRDFSSLHRSRR